MMSSVCAATGHRMNCREIMLFAGAQPRRRSSSSGRRSTTTGLPSTRHALQLVEESVELKRANPREAIIATGWSQMVRRRILDSEQVV